MIRTSTKNSLNPITGLKAKDSLDQNENQFYQAIKPRLNSLFKNAPNECIAKILLYSKSAK